MKKRSTNTRPSLKDFTKKDIYSHKEKIGLKFMFRRAIYPRISQYIVYNERKIGPECTKKFRLDYSFNP